MSGDRTGRCRLLAWMLLASALIPVSRSVAQTPPPASAPGEASADAKERARAAYTRGQAAFAAGDFQLAHDSFQQAFDALPNPIVLLSLSESSNKLGRVEDAIAALDRYLQLRPDAPDRADIELKRHYLVITPATLVIITEPPGADVLVDGQPTGKQTPTDFQLSPGAHQLEVVLLGYEKSAEPLQVAPGARLERNLTLQKPPPPAPPPAPLAPPEAAKAPPPKPEVPTTALWITGGIGAAGLIAGTVLGFMALKEHSDFEARPTEPSADRGERLALFADVGFGVGAMALVTAAVLYLTYDDVPAESASLQRPQQTARIEIVPAVSPTAASATARIRF